MILLGLNELNLEYLLSYIDRYPGRLSNFENLLSKGFKQTISEKEYDKLEPWIQWVTVHSGQSYKEHGIFRLGDIVDRPDVTQLYEVLEGNGFSVGAVSPFNADNRLKNPKFFIPDPWTKTPSSGSFLVRKLSSAVSNLVNSNAGNRVGFFDVFWVGIGFLKFCRFSAKLKLFELIKKRNKPGVRAAILDILLLEAFVHLQRKYTPTFSEVFFNGLAHIQHHYLYSSTVAQTVDDNPEWYCPKDWDPLLFILEIYDEIVGELAKSGEDMLAVTALRQVPHRGTTYYWRITNHTEFFDKIFPSLNVTASPRMSRDCLLNFRNEEESIIAEQVLQNAFCKQDDEKIFSVDNRGLSLFIELVYPFDIKNKEFVIGDHSFDNLNDKLSFVCLKNGIHDTLGYVFGTFDLGNERQIQLKEVYNLIINRLIKNESNSVQS
ncbi:hypothetical protein N9Y33_04285 [Bacteroidia bacterium]|nr:hypothetical protein [Bacteroidia bacterium]